MRKLLVKLAGTASAAITSLAAVSFALALTIPPTFAPRAFQTQQTHYLRFEVDFNSCVLASGTCSVKVGALPYNAFVVRAYQQIVTNFNSATTDTVALATASGGGQIVAAQSVHAGAGGATSLTVVAANVGTAATGAGIAQTGGNGGFDVWAVYAQTGAAPSAGKAIYVIEYFGPNDGTCGPVTMGATAVAC